MNKEKLLAFNVFCSWILRYDHDYQNFNGNNFGSFKRYQKESYTHLIELFGKEISVDNMLEFTIHAYSKIKTEELRYHSGILLDQVSNNKFRIGNKDISEYNDKIQPINDLKQKLLDKYKKTVIQEVEFPRDDSHLEITVGNLSTNTQVILDTQPQPPSDTQILNQLNSLNNGSADEDETGYTDENNNELKQIKLLVVKLVEENRALREHVNSIDNKVSHSNLDQTKTLEDFEYLYLKSLRYRNHNNLFRNHFNSNPKTFPENMDIKRYPTCIFKHDKDFKKRYDEVIYKNQIELLNLYIEYTREKLDVIDDDVKKLSSQIKLTNPNGDKILRETINKTEIIFKKEADDSDAKFKRNLEKKLTKKEEVITSNKKTSFSDRNSRSLTKTASATSNRNSTYSRSSSLSNSKRNQIYKENKNKKVTTNNNNSTTDKNKKWKNSHNNKTTRTNSSNNNNKNTNQASSNYNQSNRTTTVNFRLAKQTNKNS